MRLAFNLTKKSGFTVLTLFVLVILLLGYWFSKSIGSQGEAERYPISWFIMVAASLGAIVNESGKGEEITKASTLWLIVYYVWKCMVSVIFALVLYMLFISELLGGELFPAFSNTDLANGGAYKGMVGFVTKVDPASHKDVAKILVWSFIAGYSERFVPNIVGQLIEKVGEE